MAYGEKQHRGWSLGFQMMNHKKNTAVRSQDHWTFTSHIIFLINIFKSLPFLSLVKFIVKYACTISVAFIMEKEIHNMSSYWIPCVCTVASLMSKSCQSIGLPGSSVHGVLQARVLEWVTMPSSRRFSWPRDWTHVSYVPCIGRWVVYPLAPPRKPN